MSPPERKLFRCRECKTELTVPLRGPLEPRETEREPVVAAGGWALEYQRGQQKCVVHCQDLRGCVLHRDVERLNGCCGWPGDLPNLVCATCGAEVATAQTDCWEAHGAFLETATTERIEARPPFKTDTGPLNFDKMEGELRRERWVRASWKQRWKRFWRGIY